MAERIYNWGIIGLGKIAHKFASDLLRLPNANLYAVASQSEERLEKFCQEFQVEKKFNSYQELIHCQEVDIVYIALPNTLHCPITLDCLNRKKAVLVEKPWAINYQEAEKMVKSSIHNNTFLMEAMWTRFLPQTQIVLQWIEDGKIGHIKSIKADFGYKMPYNEQVRTFNRSLGGGSLLDIGIYPVYLCYLLLGMPVQVQAMVSFSKTKVDETCLVHLKYPGKILCQLQSSFVYTSKTEAYIYGTQGTIHIQPRFHGKTSGLHLSLYDGIEEQHSTEWEGYGYQFEAQEVMRCLNNGSIESDRHGHDFALELTRLMDAIRIEANIVYPDQDHVQSFEYLDFEE